MSEMFEKVETNADLAKQAEIRRKEIARRNERADKRMRVVLVGVVITWVLMIMLSGFDHVSKALATTIIYAAGNFLAIWLGAWIQFRFCRKGLMQ